MSLPRVNLAQYVGSQVAPELLTAAPPPFFTERNMVTTITASCQQIVTDPSTKTGEGVPDNTFVLIWFPQWAGNAIVRFGIVPKGAQSNPGTVIPAPPVVGPYTYPVISFTTPGACSIFNVKYNSELALPYDVQSGVTQMAFEPNLQENFRSVRAISGSMQVKSDTIAAGSLSISGQGSGFVVSDTRIVAQTNGGAYTIAAMRANAETKRDSVVNVGMQDGVKVLLGPPTTQQFCPADYKGHVALDGDYQVYPYVGGGTWGGASAITGYGMRTDSGAVQNWIGSIWATPWDTQVDAYNTNLLVMPTNAYVGRATAISPSVVKLAPINEGGVYCYKMLTKWRMVSANNLFAQMQTVANAQHVFATVSPNGAVRYLVVSETKRGAVTTSTVPTAVGAGPGDYDESWEFDASWARYEGLLFMGKYIGTLLQFGIASIWDVAALNIQLEGSIVGISAFANTVATPGACGPVRIIRVDSVAAGQNVQCSAAINVQATLQSQKAAFVKDEVAFSPNVSRLEDVPISQMMFNGNGPFKRVYTIKEHAAEVNNLESTLGAEIKLTEQKAGMRRQREG